MSRCKGGLKKMTPYKGVEWTGPGWDRLYMALKTFFGWQRNRLLNWSHSFQETRKCSGHHIGVCFLTRHFPPHLGILLFPSPKLTMVPEPSTPAKYTRDVSCGVWLWGDKPEESCRASRQAHISWFMVKLEPSSLPTGLTMTQGDPTEDEGNVRSKPGTPQCLRKGPFSRAA